LCQGLIAPEFAGVDLGLAEKMAVRAVAAATGAGPEQVAARVREAGDLGQAAEQLLAETAAGRSAVLTVTAVVNTLRQIANAEGPGSQGRKLELLAGLLGQATPLEARYLLRQVTGNLRLGIGTPTILFAGQRHALRNLRCHGTVAAAVGSAESQQRILRTPAGVPRAPGPEVREPLATRLAAARERQRVKDQPT
jgi:ATP-dependent DNA ligase